MTGNLYTISIELINTILSNPLVTDKEKALKVIANMKDIIEKTMS
jgi:hypothetical protein